MANWWDNFIGNLDKGPVGYTPQYSSGGGNVGANAAIDDTQRMYNQRERSLSPAMAAAAAKQKQDLASLGGADKLRGLIGGELSRQQAAGQAQVPSFQDFLAMLGAGGGGGVNLSGYDSMLSDITAREGALGERNAEQKAYIEGIISAGRNYSQAQKDAIAGRYSNMLTEGTAREGVERSLIGDQEANRLAIRDAARAALGAQGGADQTSAESASAQGAVSARGDVASRDAGIQQSIENQQYSNQLAGYDPMQARYSTALSNAYEDRLAQLASERAAIQQQRAQAASSGGGGNSLSSMLSAFGAYQDLIGPGEGPDISGTALQVLDQYAGTNPANASLYQDIFANQSSLFSAYDLANTGKLMDPMQVANLVVGANPGLAPGYAFIVDLVKQNQNG